MPKLQENDWNKLVVSIADRNCVLMLGPDAIQEVVGGMRRPVMARFADRLWSRLGHGPTPPSWSSFQIAQKFRNTFNTETLRVEAESFFSDWRRKKALYRPSLEHLAALPFRLIVTTMPGDEFEWVLGRGHSDFYDFRGQTRQIAIHRGSGPLVYHLYGSWSESRSMVLSENDLLDFLVRVIKREPALPDAIKKEFRNHDRCFLFLGFGLRAWSLRIFLHAFYEGGSSYALEIFDQPISSEQPAIREHFFQVGSEIQFFRMDLDAFAEELRRRCDERKQATAVEPARNARKVFICHASENKHDAMSLYADLKQNGLDPFLDVKSLAPGRAWEEALEQAIETVDYVVVLHSKALRARREGPVFQELRWALKREKRINLDSERPFIIPVRVDDTSLMKSLSKYQAVELSDTEALVRALI